MSAAVVNNVGEKSEDKDKRHCEEEELMDKTAHVDGSAPEDANKKKNKKKKKKAGMFRSLKGNSRPWH